jgi:hypothetical protein
VKTVDLIIDFDGGSPAKKASSVANMTGKGARKCDCSSEFS